MTRRLPLSSCSVDLDTGDVDRDGAIVRLRTKELQLLSYLVERPRQDISREQLHTEVWGYARGVRTRTLYNTVRRLRETVEANPSEPDHVVTVFGTGYRFVPTAAAPVTRPRFAGAPQIFLGREDLAAEVTEALQSHSIVTLTGPAGVGKTRLAQHCTQILQVPMSWCDASEAITPDDFLRALAVALGVAGPTQGALDAAIAARGPLVLVIDNLEQLMEFAPAMISRWATGDVRVLATSRERLRLGGEHCVQVPPLPLEDGLALLMHHAEAFEGDEGDLRRIVSKVDSLPLAIELAAARLRVLTPDQLLAREERWLRMLTNDDRNAPTRQESLWNAIDWSWELLHAWERSALRQCAVFRGGFDLDAFEGIVDLSAHPGAPDEVGVLQALLDKSLLVSKRTDLGVRFHMFVSIRSYLERRMTVLELDSALRRHPGYYVDLAGEAASLEGGARETALVRLALEHENLLAAFERALVIDPTLAADAAQGLLLLPCSPERRRELEAYGV